MGPDGPDSDSDSDSDSDPPPRVTSQNR